jgi:hypothetical protein
MTYHQVCNKSNTTGATTGVGTTYPSGAPEFTSGFRWGTCCSILVFCVMFCRSLFVCPSSITGSDFPFGILFSFFSEAKCHINKNVDIKYSAHDTFLE